jgi:adhesin transport system membrane fusion protein
MNKHRITLWTSVLAVGAAVAWASWAQIDQITRATGQIIASSRSQVIQAPDGGILSALHVKEGELVSKGQSLATLDSTRIKAAYMETDAKASALRCQVARLRAEVLGGSPQFADLAQRYPDLVSTQQKLFEKRQTAIREDLAALSRALELAKKELSLSEPLLSTGDISRTEVIRLQRQVADIDTQMVSRRNKYFQDAQADLVKAEEELAGITQNLAQRQDTLDHAELKAPLAGLVKNIRVTTVGGVLKPGEELLQIVPSDDDLLVEVKIRPQDVTHLKPGLPATVKIDAYDYSIYGSLPGELTYLSPDTLSEDIKPNEQPYYRARIRTQRQALQTAASGKAAERIALQPGMTATVEIKTGDNTVLRYLFKPVVKTLSEAFHEK